MQVIGLCRFSYPAMGGFQVEHETTEERIAYLYDTARMEERLRYFECICLPGLKAQTDPDFLFVILVGEAMPARWRARLEALVADFPQARIVARAPGPHRKVCQEVINAMRDMRRPCLQFRHDDDDAVSVDFVALLRAAARDCAALTRAHPMVGFDWNRGYILWPGPEGLQAEEAITPYWGVAQGMAVQAGEKLTVLNFMHSRIARFMPTVTFTAPHAFVRSHNNFNDSRGNHPDQAKPLPLLDAAGEAEMRSRFAIDADHVRRVFATGP